MKKNLRYFMTLLLMMIASVGWGADTVVETIDFTGGNPKVSAYGDTSTWGNWTVVGGANNGGGWAYLRIGGGKTYNGPSTITGTSPLSSVVDFIIIEHAGRNNSGYSITSVVVQTSISDDFTNPTSTTVNNPDVSSAGQITITPTSPIPANSYFKIIINWSGPNNSNTGLNTKTIKFYKKEAVAVEAPTFSVAEGTYTSAQSVELSCVTEGASIYYTTDGTEPTAASTPYTGAISISETTTLKAIAVKGEDVSSVASATYTIVDITGSGTETNPYTVAQARAAIDANTGTNNVYAKGIVSKIVTVYNDTYKNITFDFVDVEGDANSIRAYRCTGDEAANVAVGDRVVVKGNLTLYNSIYEFSENCQLVSLQTKLDPELSFNVETVTATHNAEDFNAPELNNPHNLSIIWASSDENVAVVEDGVVIIGDEGTTVITATFEGNGTYKAGSASYTIIVGNPKGTINNPYSVTDVIDGTAKGTGIYVEGYIVGQYTSGNDPATSNFPDNGNIALADEFTTSPTAAASIPVQLGTDALKNAWGNKANNGSKITYKVRIKGNFDTYFSVNGIKSTTEITPVAVNVTIGSTGYATMYYSDVNVVVPENVTATTYKVESGSLVESKSYAAGVTIPKAEAVLLNGETDNYDFVISEATATKDADNKLLGTDYATETTGGSKYYALATNAAGDADSVGFYWQAADGGAFTNGAHKAYLALPATGAKSAYLFSEDISTGINGVNKSNNADVRYNMQGQRVGNAYKGVVIMNGKKFLQK